MNQIPETAALLDSEQIARIDVWRRLVLANYEKHSADESINAVGFDGVEVLLDDMAALLADRAAFRQQVAAELASIEVAILKAPDQEYNEVYEAFRAAANRLNINLSATPDPSL